MEALGTGNRSIAVIASGVAGLKSAYPLSARDRVRLFKADQLRAARHLGADRPRHRPATEAVAC